MCVGPQVSVDTIGGGHLEWKAIAHAREVIQQAKPRREVLRYPLGPSLGQCCGGVVWLGFEYLDASDLPWCEQVLAALQGGAAVRRFVPLDGGAARIELLSEARLVDSAAWDEERNELVDTLGNPALDVIVCGAGHVGQAIVRVLRDLPLRVIWLDPREGCWPEAIPGNVECLQGDADDVPDLPDNAYWLVLTHSHALDLQIIEAVLQHKSFCFLGVIGSKSKKARFVSRLSQRFPQEQVQRLHCPIGLLATSSKVPAVIAVSVAAELLAFIAA